VGIWKHLAVTADGGKITLFVDGETYATLDAPLPALAGPLVIGVEGTADPGFLGEVDELEISNVARNVGAIKLAAIGQSRSDRSTKLLVVGPDEGGQGKNELLEQMSLFGEISKSLTFDGWIVIGLCTLMAFLGWFVAIRKYFLLNRLKKGADVFLKQWEELSTDLTKLDHTNEENVRSFGGVASAKAQRLMLQSPLFHLYHIGSKEIRHRLEAADGFKGLSARSIQAIRASLDGGLTREVQSLNGDLIFLTISIAGGPYLGLLGTVIGVMITFATIAKTGQVEVNSIAPGIAGALLATVAGLLVAIPALFIYSYLSSRIKDAVNNMHTFVDEFISKIAEFYPETK
jgi:biopolymer transport protein ExbB